MKTQKKCVVCGDIFSPTGPRSTKCEKCLTKFCTVCGNVVPKTKTGRTCSPECAYKARAASSTLEYTCAVPGCSVVFHPHNPGQKWCSTEHSRICRECQSAFTFTPTSKPPVICASCRSSRATEARNASRREHYRENFGVDSAFHLGSIQDKVKATNKKRYGVANQFQRSEIKKKIRKDNLEKHGVEHNFQRDDVKQKIRKTHIEKYGVDHPMRHLDFAKKQHESVVKNYGNNPYSSPEITARKKRTALKNYGVDSAMKSSEFQKEYSKNFEEKHGVDWPILLAKTPGRISKPNIEFHAQLIQETGIFFEFEKGFAGVGAIDLYAEHNGVKVAVEISPTATHNSHMNKIACNRKACVEFPCKKHGKKKSYHQDRALELKEKHGVDLITVFDWTDKNKAAKFIKAKLKLQSNKVGARQCELRKISQKEANVFLKNHHILGASQRQKHCYGLYYEGKLLQVQTFAEMRNGDWEAKRLATHPDWVVIGGVSRGTKAFIDEVKPERIVAFASLDLGLANFDSLYNNFTQREIQAPVKCWSKGSKMILAKSAAFQSADRLLGIASDSKTSPYPEDWSNDDVFLAEGWLPVWDCGKIKEIWVSRTSK